MNCTTRISSDATC